MLTRPRYRPLAAPSLFCFRTSASSSFQRYAPSMLRTDTLGRSHRSKISKARLKYAIEESKRILGIPEDYLLGIVSRTNSRSPVLAIHKRAFHVEKENCAWYADVFVYDSLFCENCLEAVDADECLKLFRSSSFLFGYYRTF